MSDSNSNNFKKKILISLILIAIIGASLLLCLYLFSAEEHQIDDGDRAINILKNHSLVLTPMNTDELSIYENGDDESVVEKRLYRINDSEDDYIVLYYFVDNEANRKAEKKIETLFFTENDTKSFSIDPLVFKNMTLAYISIFDTMSLRSSSFVKNEQKDLFKDAKIEIILDLCDGSKYQFIDESDHWKGTVDIIYFKEKVGYQEYHYCPETPYLEYVGKEDKDEIIVNAIKISGKTWSLNKTADSGSVIDPKIVNQFPTDNSNEAPSFEDGYFIDIEWNGQFEQLHLVLEESKSENGPQD